MWNPDQFVKDLINQGINNAEEGMGVFTKIGAEHVRIDLLQRESDVRLFLKQFFASQGITLMQNNQVVSL